MKERFLCLLFSCLVKIQDVGIADSLLPMPKIRTPHITWVVSGGVALDAARAIVPLLSQQHQYQKGYLGFHRPGFQRATGLKRTAGVLACRSDVDSRKDKCLYGYWPAKPSWFQATTNVVNLLRVLQVIEAQSFTRTI